MFSYSKLKATNIARYIFRISGIYGILILTPQFFRENAFAPLTHPEFFYGFFIVSFAFQVLFLTISSDPIKYRQAMLACFIEKGGHITSCVLLFATGRLDKEMLIASSPDALMLSLFIYSYIMLSAKNARP